MPSVAGPVKYMGKNKIGVEVVYALPNDQQIFSTKVAEGATVGEAIRDSGILERYSEINLGTVNKVGIFGKLCKQDRVLNEGDRVEIYRPLIADPKEVRRKRAAEGKVMTRGAAEKSPSS